MGKKENKIHEEKKEIIYLAYTKIYSDAKNDFSRAVIKSVVGSVLKNLIPMDRKIIIKAYKNEKQKRSKYFMDALKDINFDDLFYLINNVDELMKIGIDDICNYQEVIMIPTVITKYVRLYGLPIKKAS